jgi:nucleotide-binding universal stress UspA family protein
MFSNLLVPLDGSQLAESVLPIVRGLAERLNSAVILIHVIEKRAPSTIHGDTHLQDVPEAERYLASVGDLLTGWGLRVSTHVHTVPQGDIPKCIADHAIELGQDLIVLCTHGSSGVRRFVFGSNAEQVLTHGATPVLLVKADEQGRAPAMDGKSIVALLDKDAESAPVLTSCAELAMIFAARIHLLYVVPTLSTVKPEEAPGGRLVPRATRLLLDLEADEMMARLKEEVMMLISRNIKASGSVERGEPVRAVTEAANKYHADLISFGTRGLAGLGALWANDLVLRVSTAYDGILLLFPTRKD